MQYEFFDRFSAIRKEVIDASMGWLNSSHKRVMEEAKSVGYKLDKGESAIDNIENFKYSVSRFRHTLGVAARTIERFLDFYQDSRSQNEWENDDEIDLSAKEVNELVQDNSKELDRFEAQVSSLSQYKGDPTSVIDDLKKACSDFREQVKDTLNCIDRQEFLPAYKLREELYERIGEFYERITYKIEDIQEQWRKEIARFDWPATMSLEDKQKAIKDKAKKGANLLNELDESARHLLSLL